MLIHIKTRIKNLDINLINHILSIIISNTHNMALSRFNKFLVLKKYAEQVDNTWQIVMKTMIDSKKLMKEFKENEKWLKLYYTLRSKHETSSFKYNQLKNWLIFL